jgi:hypothetical protein
MKALLAELADREVARPSVNTCVCASSMVAAIGKAQVT